MVRKLSDECVSELFLEICTAVDSPLSISAWIRYKYEPRLLLELDINPSDYLSAPDFAKDYLVISFLKKFKGLNTGLDTRSAALSSWRAAESKCLVTNRRFRTSATHGEIPWIESVFYRAQLKIADVLARLDVPSLLEGGRWGPGATFDLRRRSGQDIKQSSPATVTSGCLRYAMHVIGHDPRWFESITGIRPDGPVSPLLSCFRVVSGNRFLTVPKNAKTDRCIAAEPTMNGFIQLGVGRYIRSRLERFGIRLDDQSVNQNLARSAWSDRLATLDLSAASDSISRELVMSLLPIDWACFLDDIRSKSSLVDGDTVPLSKFSSMGNGFTFELETLIFWALSGATLEERKFRNILAVYGDDIIVPAEAYDDVVSVLQYAGFSVNPEKSFSDGPFYESCGKHYFQGVDVTPCFQKEELLELTEYFRTFNRLVRWNYRMTGTWNSNFTRRVRRLIELYARQAYGPRSVNFAIPYGAVGDGGFLRHPADLSRPDRNHGIPCQVLIWRERSQRALDLPLYAIKLRRPFTTYSRQKGRNVKPMGFGSYRSAVQFFNLHDLVELNLGDPLYEGTRTLFVVTKES